MLFTNESLLIFEGVYLHCCYSIITILIENHLKMITVLCAKLSCFATICVTINRTTKCVILTGLVGTVFSSTGLWGSYCILSVLKANFTASEESECKTIEIFAHTLVNKQVSLSWFYHKMVPRILPCCVEVHFSCFKSAEPDLSLRKLSRLNHKLYISKNQQQPILTICWAGSSKL